MMRLEALERDIEDTMEQVRIDISEIENWLQQKIEF